METQREKDWVLRKDEVFNIGVGFTPAMRQWLLRAARSLCDAVCVGEAQAKHPVGIVYAGATTTDLPGLLVETIEQDFPNVHIGPLDMANFFVHDEHVYFSFYESEPLRTYRRALEHLFQPHANSAITDYQNVVMVHLGAGLRDNGPDQVEITKDLTEDDIVPTSLRFSTWDNSVCYWSTKEWLTLQGQKVIRTFRTPTNTHEG